MFEFIKRNVKEEEKPKYNFDAFYDILKKTGQKGKVDQLIKDIRSAENQSEQDRLGIALRGLMEALFADAGKEEVESFINEYVQFKDLAKAEFPTQESGSLVSEAAVGNPTSFEYEISQQKVVPNIVRVPSQFDGLEPVAPPTTITPSIILERKRRDEVSAHEARQQEEDAIMKRLIEEAKNEPVKKISEKYISPYEGGEPAHRAKNDSLPGADNIDWAPAGPETLVHPKPPQHLR